MNHEEATWKEFRDNLSYYIVDALSPGEKAVMDAFIAGHPGAQAELDAERRLQIALRTQSERMHVDVEAGVARLLRELKAEAISPTAAQAVDDTNGHITNRIRRWVDRLGTRRLAAGAATIVIAQAVIIAFLIPRERHDPASGFRGTAPDVAAEADYKLYPNANSAYAELAELLLSTGCAFVHGPDPDGAVHVNCTAAYGHQQQLRAVAALRASPLLADVVVLKAE